MSMMRFTGQPERRNGWGLHFDNRKNHRSTLSGAATTPVHRRVRY